MKKLIIATVFTALFTGSVGAMDASENECEEWQQYDCMTQKNKKKKQGQPKNFTVKSKGKKRPLKQETRKWVKQINADTN